MALKIDSGSAEAYNNLGLILTEEKKYQEALLLFNKAIRISSMEPYFYNNKAFAEIMVNDYKNASDNIKISMGKNDKNPWVHRNLGILNLKQKKYAEALKNLKRSLELSGEEQLSNLHFYLGEAYYFNNQMAEACIEYNQSVLLNECLGKTTIVKKMQINTT